MELMPFIIAFFAGLISVFSPCLLPLLPIYLCYLSGVKMEDLGTEREKHHRLLHNSIAFALGYTVVFTVMGGLAGLLGVFLEQVKSWLPRLGGLMMMIFGLYMMQIVNIPFLDRERQFKPHFQKLNLATSFVFGMTFSISWIPCISPILSSILMIAATSASLISATSMLFAYGIGMAVPFIFIGLFARSIFRLIEQNQNLLKYYNYIAGIFLIVIGIFVFLNKLNWLFKGLATE